MANQDQNKTDMPEVLEDIADADLEKVTGGLDGVKGESTKKITRIGRVDRLPTGAAIDPRRRLTTRPRRSGSRAGRPDVRYGWKADLDDPSSIPQPARQGAPVWRRRQRGRPIAGDRLDAK
jgi:hypothetical protein